MKTAEQILKEITNEKGYWQPHQLAKNDILQAMEEYATQSRPAVLMPTKEQIEKQFPLTIPVAKNNFDRGYEIGCQHGAKWLLSQVQAIDGRELLMKFCEFMDNMPGEQLGNTDEWIIASFLREEGKAR